MTIENMDLREEDEHYEDLTEGDLLEVITRILYHNRDLTYRIHSLMGAPRKEGQPVLEIDVNTDIQDGGEYYRCLKYNPELIINATTEAVKLMYKEVHQFDPKEDIIDKKFYDSIKVELRGYQTQYTISKDDVSTYVHLEGKVTALEHQQTVKTKFKYE